MKSIYICSVVPSLPGGTGDAGLFLLKNPCIDLEFHIVFFSKLMFFGIKCPTHKQGTTLDWTHFQINQNV